MVHAVRHVVKEEETKTHTHTCTRMRMHADRQVGRQAAGLESSRERFNLLQRFVAPRTSHPSPGAARALGYFRVSTHGLPWKEERKARKKTKRTHKSCVLNSGSNNCLSIIPNAMPERGEIQREKKKAVKMERNEEKIG